MAEAGNQFIEGVVKFLETIGLVPRPDAVSLITDYYLQDKPAEMVGTLLGLHHASKDYLTQDPERIVRASETVLATFKSLKLALEEKRVSQEEWDIARGIAQPLATPGPNTLQQCHRVLAEMGAEDLCECVRQVSERQLATRQLLDDAYDEYAENHKPPGLLSRFFRRQRD